MNEYFKLIVITPEKDIKDESALINALFEADLPLLHLRKPDSSYQDVSKLVKSIAKEFHPQIVLHNNYGLLNEYNVKGIHLPEKVRKEGITKEIKRIVSTSFHKQKEILHEKINFEYAFFSPVFQSVSKKGYEPSIAPETLNTFFQTKEDQILFPIIALGGITDKNILAVKEMGFKGAASIGYIWENPNPVGQFKKLQNMLQV